MSNKKQEAPGKPGDEALWTPSSKSGVGKSLNALSNVSFTLGNGIVNEVYYPREDYACIRDMELLISDGANFFSEEKCDTEHSIKMMKEGVPAFLITNTCKEKKFKIEKEILTDPLRDTLLQQIKFTPTKNEKEKLHLYVLLSPHINNKGGGNTAWIAEHNGVPMLFAKREHTVLALACSCSWRKRSAGFVGASDGWTDIHQHKQMDWEYQKAEKGNVALTGEIDLGKEDTFQLALGFGDNAMQAGHNAWGSLMDGFDFPKKRYIEEWENWHNTLSHFHFKGNKKAKLSTASAMVLRAHESKLFVGAAVASMSFPWGYSKGDSDVGGYHMVWPRDLVETAGGFLSLKSKQDAFRILNYLMITQRGDGHWSQNMWIGGEPNWQGIQMDQMALPLVLLALCKKHDAIRPEVSHLYWEVVKKAASFLVQHGPETQMDRWEEEPGLSPFTLSVSIAALLTAAHFAEENKEPEVAKYCRETADYWNENMENWLYVTDTSLAKEVGVEGYYIRTNPTGVPAKDLEDQTIDLKNNSQGNGVIKFNELISIDALALVRYGLRKADDSKILNTIKVIDAKLKTETPSGPCWHRYNRDGYGEYEDGSPFDGAGIGRGWPLLSGERAHYEIAAGNFEKGAELLKTMENYPFGNLLPEQIWEQEDIPEKGLYNGKPSGSAMPLVWAHAEYLKLCRSLKDKKVFDMPEYTVERYIQKKAKKTGWKIWRFEYPCNEIPSNKNLRIETKAPARIRWSYDDWDTVKDTQTKDTGMGMYVADLKVKSKKPEKISFTFYWTDTEHWEKENFEVSVKK